MTKDKARIEKITADPPLIKDRPITVAFKTSHPILRQSCQQQNKLAFDVITKILRKTLEKLLNDDLELPICDKMLIKQLEIAECLNGFDNIVEQRIIDSSSGHSVIFEFGFGTQNSALLGSLSKPKFTVITKRNLDQLLTSIDLGFDNTALPLQKNRFELNVQEMFTKTLYS